MRRGRFLIILPVLLVSFADLLPGFLFWPQRHLRCARAAGEAVGPITVERQISKARQEELGTTSWASWDTDTELTATWPVTYADPETVFVLEGSATVGPEGGSTVELQPGDLASFPPGQTFIWTVQSAPLRMKRGIRTQSGKIVAPLSWR
ncbi:unnamed protein product [Cladocopium goreaui]|uniref:(S)-ureidoglycine aminohydrolase cupin domain-containing protein n=1 Tax=Cladocopium goreaui TaxID=2562237 RepID=A0A9P1BNQ3_9DINO|nr:unnamed protein product [Cladocopium goreaui]